MLAGGLSKGSVPSWHSQGTNRAKNNAFTLVLYLALLTLVVGCQKQWINFTLYAIIRHQPQLYNIVQWITRLGGRWRTQLTARRNVNCRIYEHRHFERILRNGACRLSMSGSGSVIHPSSSLLCLLLALSSRWSFVYSVTLRFVAFQSVARADSLEIFSRVRNTVQLVATASFSFDRERHTFIFDLRLGKTTRRI